MTLSCKALFFSANSDAFFNAMNSKVSFPPAFATAILFIYNLIHIILLEIL